MSGPATIAKHAVALATVRAFGRASGAERVVLLVDQGEAEPVAMVEWLAGDGLIVIEGEAAHELTDVPGGARPKDLPDLRPIPAAMLDLDEERGELAAPLGAVQHLAEGVLALARAFGGRSVATAEFATRRPERPLTVAGRPGEPVVLAVGDHRFELPE